MAFASLQNCEIAKNTIIQPKLAINFPGDSYEQEADAMADRVMRLATPETTFQSKPMTGLIGRSAQRKCTHCEEEEKKKPIMRRAESGFPGMPVSLSFASSLNALKGGGFPLPHVTKSFMENAFSSDFTDIRIHADSKASVMSKGINAKAFTYGNDIYFNSGEYQPNTASGKQLLAHEITHTVQQGGGIKRKISYVTPTPVEKDPVVQILTNQKLGKTYPTFNGKKVPDVPPGGDMKEARMTLLTPLIPKKITISEKGEIFTAQAESQSIDLTISALIETIIPATDDVWVGSCPPIPVPAQLRTKCTSKNSIPVEMTGFPTLYNTVIKHENEHWVDLRTLANSELKPVHDLILGLTGTGNTKEKAASDLDIKLGAAANGIIKSVDNFFAKMNAATNVYDAPGSGTHFTKTKIVPNSDCTKIFIRP